MTDHTTVPVRDAATVMLVRDAPTLEVFMLRRSSRSVFVAGAYVFPGGAVDPDDRVAHLEPACVGRDDRGASALLGLESGGLAYWVAAIRECFEEAGVLLARDLDGALVDFSDPEVARRFAEHRAAVDAGERRLVDVVDDEGLVLDLSSIHYFSHWITPGGAPRRYDTRFFVTVAPEAQTPLHDDRETVASLWIEPAEALERRAAGDMELIFPTIRSLEALTRFESAGEVVEAARAVERQVPGSIAIVDDASGSRIPLPGDPGHRLETARGVSGA